MGYLGLIVIHADRDSPGNAMLDDRDENPIVKKEKEMTIRKFIDGDISPERRAKIITATTNHYTAFSDEGKEMIIAEHIEAAIANVTRPASPEQTERERLGEELVKWATQFWCYGGYCIYCLSLARYESKAHEPTRGWMCEHKPDCLHLRALRAAGGESGAKGGEG